MFNETQRQEYCIKTCPSDNPELLEEILNGMSKEGWELYTMHEVEGKDGFQYNCIFVRDFRASEEMDENLSYHSQMEKMLFSASGPYELCINLQKKIKEKRLAIQNIKALLDNTSERDVLNEEINKNLNELNELKKQLNEVLVFENASEQLKAEKISVELSEEAGCLISPDLNNNLISQSMRIRQELVDELGYIIPKIRFVQESKLESYCFTVSIHSIPVISACVYPGFVMYYEDEMKFPKGAIKDVDILSGRKTFWLKEEKTADYWIKGISPSEYVANVIKAICIKYVDEIIDYNDINRYVEIVGEKNLFLIENIIPDFLSVGEVKYILSKLLKEKISIKDIIYIFEKLNDFSNEESKEHLYGKIRLSLSRQIVHSLADDQGVIEAYELSDETIKQLEKCINTHNDLIKINTSKFKKLIKKIEQIGKIDGTNKVFSVPMHLREVFFAVLNPVLFNFSVICEEEVVSPYSVKIIDNI